MYIILIYQIKRSNLTVKMKSIFTYSLGAMVLLSGFIATNALAKGDTKDSNYYLEMPKGYHVNAYTSARTKYNDSSVYQKNSWIGKDRTLRLWIVDKDKKDTISGGHYVDITSGQHKNIPSVAYEKRGKTSVRIAGKSEALQTLLLFRQKEYGVPIVDDRIISQITRKSFNLSSYLNWRFFFVLSTVKK